MDTYSRINLLDNLQRKIFILLFFIRTLIVHKGDLNARWSYAVKVLTFRPLALIPITVAA